MGRRPVAAAIAAATLSVGLLASGTPAAAASCTSTSCSSCPPGAECLPAPPQAVSSVSATAHGGEVAVSWTTLLYPNAVGYKVSSSIGDLVTVGSAERTATLGGLNPGATATVTVVAYNSGGDSSPKSITVTATGDAEKAAAVATPPAAPAVPDGAQEAGPLAAAADSTDSTAVAKVRADFVLDQNDARRAQISSASVSTRVSQFNAAKNDVHAAATYSETNGSGSFLDRSAEGATTSGSSPTYSAATSVFRAKMSAAYSVKVAAARSLELIDFIAGSAADSFYPSVTDGEFKVTTWQGVTVSGSSATGLVSGYYTTQFTDSSGVAASVDEVQSQFTFSMTLEGGRWRLVAVDGTSAVEDGYNAADTSSSTTSTVTTTTFSRSGAYRYASYYYNHRNVKYLSFGSNCTNFASQVWHEGAGVPEHPYYWYMDKGLTSTWSNSWTTVRGFRSYWYDHGRAYYYVSGRGNLQAKYSERG